MVPEFADGSGDVFGGGVADPGEDFDEAGVAGSVVGTGDEMGLGEDETFLAIEVPNVGEDALKLGFGTGFDVVGDQHGFGGDLALGLAYWSGWVVEQAVTRDRSARVMTMWAGFIGCFCGD